MRRGTTAAKIFGEYLRARREELGLSMAAVGRRINAPTATVSQVELAQRAVKPPKLDGWAAALDLNQADLHIKYHQLDQEYPAPALIRLRGKEPAERTMEQLVRELNSQERSRVQGYIDCLVEMRDE